MTPFGLLDIFDSEGTFSTLEFLDCIRQLVKKGEIEQYPGRNSVWIVDNASIHQDPNIVHYLRSIGVVVRIYEEAISSHLPRCGG
jgi:hypothetical protein